MDQPAFEEARIEVRFQKFECPRYDQVLGEFIPNLSAIDYFFHCGPAAARSLFAERQESLTSWQSAPIRTISSSDAAGPCRATAARATTSTFSFSPPAPRGATPRSATPSRKRRPRSWRRRDCLSGITKTPRSRSVRSSSPASRTSSSRSGRISFSSIMVRTPTRIAGTFATPRYPPPGSCPTSCSTRDRARGISIRRFSWTSPPLSPKNSWPSTPMPLR